MKAGRGDFICHLRAIRQAKGVSQNELAEWAGVKRQAIYDIESGRYAPNTALALRLARRLGCRVEDLFTTRDMDEGQSVRMVGNGGGRCRRIALTRVRGRLVGYPLNGADSLNDGFQAADGLLGPGGDTVKLLCPPEILDNTLLLLGCDPAFAILGAHVSRGTKEARLHWRFASSHAGVEGIANGEAHVAGTHVHNAGAEESNVSLVRRLLKDFEGIIVGFSLMEEGLMVARGNPLGIRTVADLAREEVLMANREPGAALRMLLDDLLARAGIPCRAVRGYDLCVSGHKEGAQKVASCRADAALGLRAVAEAYCLGFVPIQAVRCDIVVPRETIDHPAVKVMLDVLQTRSLREEINSLPGYDSSSTGKAIAET